MNNSTSNSFLSAYGSRLRCTRWAMEGKDMGINDINNMGAAMAPAAASTIKQYLMDTGTRPQDYDGIYFPLLHTGGRHQRAGGDKQHIFSTSTIWEPPWRRRPPPPSSST